MARGSALRQLPPDPPSDKKGDRFSMYATEEFGQRVRDFCFEKRVTFNEAANIAMAELMERYQSKPLPRRSKLPPGPRIRRRRNQP